MRFKAVAGMVDEAGGIAVRLLTPDDYYVAGANELEDIVGFYRVVKGQHEQLASLRRCRLAAGLSQDQRQCKGVRQRLAHARDRFTVSFVGKPVISAQDKTFSDRGKVALWTKGDSVTYFDTISITPLG
jgi:hypothetical protein